jgi:transposase InsO family protein
VAESFFSTLEHELGGEAKWATRMEAIRAVSEYIDGFYNPTRRHSTLDGLSPIEFERRFRERGDQETGGFAPACKSFSGEERLQESPEAAA